MNTIIDYVRVAFKSCSRVCPALSLAAVALLSLQFNFPPRKICKRYLWESKNSILTGSPTPLQHRSITNSNNHTARFSVGLNLIGLINLSMLFFELRYPVSGTLIPCDHAYALFSALSRRIPAMHQTNEIFFDTLAGKIQKNCATWINPDTKLKIRAARTHLSLLLTLTYQELALQQYTIRLGVPEIVILEPASSLYARQVTIKNHQQPDTFLRAVQQKLAEQQIRSTPVVGKRRVVRIGGHTVVGFSLWLQHLSNEASLLLLRQGLGGRRHMGCGFFQGIRNFRLDHGWNTNLSVIT